MPELVKALLAKGADVNAQIIVALRLGPDDAATGFGLGSATPFFLAALSGDAELLRVLAANGADPSLRAKGELTALMAAAGAGRGMTQGTIKYRLGDPAEAVKVVLDAEADIHASNELGQTALHGAAGAGEDEVVQILVDRGAEVDAKDNDKQTPWSMAQGISPRLGSRGSYGSHPATAALLLKLGATVRTREDMIADGYSVPSVPVPQKPNPVGRQWKSVFREANWGEVGSWRVFGYDPDTVRRHPSRRFNPGLLSTAPLFAWRGSTQGSAHGFVLLPGHDLRQHSQIAADCSLSEQGRL
jgi:ankyrin repeat protein